MLLKVCIICSWTNSSPFASVWTNLHLKNEKKIRTWKKCSSSHDRYYYYNSLLIENYICVNKHLANLFDSILDQYLVTASTTLASVSPPRSGISEKRLQLVKICKASRATNLKGPARYGARRSAKKGAITSKGSITSLVGKWMKKNKQEMRDIRYHILLKRSENTNQMNIIIRIKRNSFILNIYLSDHVEHYVVKPLNGLVKSPPSVMDYYLHLIFAEDSTCV